MVSIGIINEREESLVIYLLTVLMVRSHYYCTLNDKVAITTSLSMQLLLACCDGVFVMISLKGRAAR